jgi:serine/threonine protein kinase
MTHPNVLPLLGVSKILKPLYMVSEWMDNGNITQYLKQHHEADRLQLVSSRYYLPLS